MEREVYSRWALHLARSAILNHLKDNAWKYSYDFFTKSSAQLFYNNLYELYVGSQGFARKTQMARRYGKRRRVSRKSRRRYGKRRYRRGRSNGGTRRLYRRLRNKGIFSTEVKYRDNELLGYRVQHVSSGLGPAVTFTDLSEGATYQERIGAKVFIRKIKLYMQFGCGSSGSAPQDETYIRWAIVRDKVPDAAANPAFITEPFDFFYPNPTNFNETVAGMCPFRWVNNRQAKRFQYLWGGMTKVTTNSAAGYERTMIKKIIRVNKPCQYGNEDSVNDRGPGQLYFFVWSDQYGPNSQDAIYPYLNMYYRVSFTDT